MEFAYPSLFTYFLPINYLQTFFTSHKSDIFKEVQFAIIS